MIAGSDVLNPLLLGRLKRLFGAATVGHPGEAMVAVVVEGVDGEPRLVIRRWGETYRTRCPFCKGDGLTLAVNHRYGQRDGLGRLLTFVASCSRNECLARPGNRAALGEMLGAYDGTLEEARVRPGRQVLDDRKPVELPEPLRRLDRLSGRHPARRYLAGLGLDTDRVGRVYKVGYCGDTGEAVARDRVIVPVVRRGEVRGWQALVIPPGGDRRAGAATPLKFYNAPGMRASELVYNIDRARAYETGVVVPTPADVWRFGGMAVSPVGEVWTERQCRSIAVAFRRKTLVLVADAARLERPSARAMVEFFDRRMTGSFAVVTLPEPRREAFDRKFLRDLVAGEAGRLGVAVRYTKSV